MKAIGGYFELEVGRGKMPYPDAVPVNFGRGGLELIVRTRGYGKIWVPDYICPVVPQFLSRIGVKIGTYEINERLEPVSIPMLGANEAFLYVNYFGLKDTYCRMLEREQPHLILDLTQAFYFQPNGADGFNSARKFFGVPDGGFVFGEGMSDKGLPSSISYDACESLVRRADGDVAGGYVAFQAHEDGRANATAAKMSALTRHLLGGISHDVAMSRRQGNFMTLHRALAAANRFSVPDGVTAPLVYPYWVNGGSDLRRRLIDSSVFCPAFWPNVLLAQSGVRSFMKDTVFLPVDHRYGREDMERIIRLIKEAAC